MFPPLSSFAAPLKFPCRSFVAIAILGMALVPLKPARGAIFVEATATEVGADGTTLKKFKSSSLKGVVTKNPEGIDKVFANNQIVLNEGSLTPEFASPKVGPGGVRERSDLKPMSSSFVTFQIALTQKCARRITANFEIVPIGDGSLNAQLGAVANNRTRGFARQSKGELTFDLVTKADFPNLQLPILRETDQTVRQGDWRIYSRGSRIGLVRANGTIQAQAIFEPGDTGNSSDPNAQRQAITIEIRGDNRQDEFDSETLVLRLTDNPRGNFDQPIYTFPETPKEGRSGPFNFNLFSSQVAVEIVDDDVAPEVRLSTLQDGLEDGTQSNNLTSNNAALSGANANPHLFQVRLLNPRDSAAPTEREVSVQVATLAQSQAAIVAGSILSARDESGATETYLNDISARAGALIFDPNQANFRDLGGTTPNNTSELKRLPGLPNQVMGSRGTLGDLDRINNREARFVVLVRRDKRLDEDRGAGLGEGQLSRSSGAPFEQYGVKMFGATQATEIAGRTQVIAAITDDDAPPLLSFTAQKVQKSETDKSGAGNAQLTVANTNAEFLFGLQVKNAVDASDAKPTERRFTVNFQTRGKGSGALTARQTATTAFLNDFAPRTGKLFFDPNPGRSNFGGLLSGSGDAINSNSAAIRVLVRGDVRQEETLFDASKPAATATSTLFGDETFQIFATVAQGQERNISLGGTPEIVSTGTILDDDLVVSRAGFGLAIAGTDKTPRLRLLADSFTPEGNGSLAGGINEKPVTMGTRTVFPNGTNQRFSITLLGATGGDAARPTERIVRGQFSTRDASSNDGGIANTPVQPIDNKPVVAAFGTSKPIPNNRLSDYGTTSGALVFDPEDLTLSAGQANAAFNLNQVFVSVRGDGRYEGGALQKAMLVNTRFQLPTEQARGEIYYLRVQATQFATLQTVQATGVIRDDDAAPILTDGESSVRGFKDISEAEDTGTSANATNDGNRTSSLTLRLIPGTPGGDAQVPSELPVIFRYQTSQLALVEGRVFPAEIKVKSSDREDYLPLSSTLVTLNPLAAANKENTLFRNIRIALKADNYDEESEKFQFDLASLPQADGIVLSTLKGGDRALIYNLEDNDAPALLSVQDRQGAGALNEPANATVASQTVIDLISGGDGQGSERDISVDYSLSDGTALRGEDYGDDAAANLATFKRYETGGSGQIVGDIARPATFSLLGDAVDEDLENFTLTLDSPVNATLQKPVANLEINDDPTDLAPQLEIVFSSNGLKTFTQREKDAGETTSIAFTVRLRNPQTGGFGAVANRDTDLTLGLFDAAGNALTTSDVAFPSGPYVVTLQAGQTSTSGTIDVVGDDAAETLETFFLGIASRTDADTRATNSGNLSSKDAALSVQDDDGARNLAVVPVTPATLSADESATTRQFKVRLEDGSGNLAPRGQSITVQVASSDGTAFSAALVASDTTVLQERDFDPFSDSVTFAPGETEKTLTTLLNINDDALDEDSENLTLTATASSGVRPADQAVSSATATPVIEDNDAPALLKLTGPPAAIRERNSGTQPLTFTLTRADGGTGAITGKDVAISYSATVAANTGAGADFSLAQSNPLVIQGRAGTKPGATEIPITLNINGDLDAEEDETVTLEITNRGDGGALPVPASASGTIIDDDGARDLEITPDNSSAKESAGPRVFLIRLFKTGTNVLAPRGEALDVRVTTTDGTAKLPGDYNAINLVVTFAPGETEKAVSFAALADDLDEATENLTLGAAVSNPSGQPVNSDSVTLNIEDNDDDTPPTLIVTPSPNASEGDIGTRPLTFTVTRQGGGIISGKEIVLGYTLSIANNSGVLTDFNNTSANPLIIPADSTSAQITLAINGDFEDENDETVTLTVNSRTDGGTNAPVPAPASSTIINDDGLRDLRITPVLPASPSAAEGITSRTFNVELIDPRSGSPAVLLTPTLVRVFTTDGTAVQPGDYAAFDQTLTFTPTVASRQVTITINNDALDEIDETFTLQATATAMPLIDPDSITLTIADDDDPPTLVLTPPANVTEGNSGTQPLTFTITRQGGGVISSKNIVLDYSAAVAANTGANPDFVIASAKPLTIPAGATSGQIILDLNGDTEFEGDEVLTVSIDSRTDGGQTATPLPAPASVTILNDDALPPVLVVSGPVTPIAEGTPGGPVGTVNPQIIFTIQKQGGGPISTQDIQLDYSFSIDNPSNGTIADFTIASPTPLIIRAGDTSAQIVINVRSDEEAENDENVILSIGSRSDGGPLPMNKTAIIGNDDGSPSVPGPPSSNESSTSGSGAANAHPSNPSARVSRREEAKTKKPARIG